MVNNFDLAKAIIVFDLDDTLYHEADYVTSGVRCVAEQIQVLYGHDVHESLENSLEQDPKLDWLSLACQLARLPSTAKESLLWMYRLHLPEIRLSVPCREALKAIRSNSRGVAVLTDGRSVTQRLKLKALGLSDWPIYISEDYGLPKPDPERFKAVQADFPAAHYVYVADNVQKDFLGCNALGWIGVGMRANGRNIYSQSLDGLSSSALPKYWVNGWQELVDLLSQ